MAILESLATALAKATIARVSPWVYREVRTMFGNWFRKRSEKALMEEIRLTAEAYDLNKAIVVDALASDGQLRFDKADRSVRTYIPIRFVSTSTFAIQPVRMDLKVNVWHDGSLAACLECPDKAIPSKILLPGDRHLETINLRLPWTAEHMPTAKEAVLVEYVGEVVIAGPWSGDYRKAAFASSVYGKAS